MPPYKGMQLVGQVCHIMVISRPPSYASKFIHHVVCLSDSLHTIAPHSCLQGSRQSAEPICLFPR